MAFYLKNPWPIVKPNINKKISTQAFAPENFATEFNGIKRFFDDILSGYQGFDHLVIVGSLNTQVKTVTANYTLTDLDQTLLVNSASAVTITLPDATVMKGRVYLVMSINKGFVTVNTTASQTINGGSTIGIPNAYFHAELFSDGSNWFAI